MEQVAMSKWGTQLDALEPLWRLADLSFPSGALGIERGVGNGEELNSESLPHLYSFEPIDVSEELAFAQERRTTRFLFDYWAPVGASQEQVSVVLDALEALVELNRTLSGSVQKARVVGREIFEAGHDAPDADQVKRLARVEIETVVDE